MPRAELSIVVPTHDTRDLTGRCLASLAALGSLAEAEVLVVDDGSSDGSFEALAPHFPRATWIRHERPRGFAAAANAGLAAAGGDLLLLLNSDTELLEADLGGLRGRFARSPRLGAAGARLRNADGSPQWSGGREPGLAWLFAVASDLPARLGGWRLYRRLRPVSGAAAGPVEWLPGTALLLRREAWRRAGPFDEGYRFYAQDLELGSRLRGAGYTLEIAPELVVLHRLGGTIARGDSQVAAGDRAVARQRLDLLWPDLARWAVRNRPPGFARRGRRALAAGGALRAGALSLALAFARGERRARLAVERAAVAAARRELAAIP